MKKRTVKKRRTGLIRAEIAAHRMNTVHKMLQEGKTRKDIQKKLGLTTNMVWQDIMGLRKSFVKVPKFLQPKGTGAEQLIEF